MTPSPTSRAAAALFAAILAAAAPARASARSVSLPGDGFVCHHGVSYGPRANLPGEGDGFRGRVGAWRSPLVPMAVCRHETAQDFDLYIPSGAAPGAPLVLFLHAGFWSQPFDKGYVPPALLRRLVADGAIVCSPNYILQPDVTMNVSDAVRPEATFAEMLRDVDLAVTRLKRCLERLGHSPSRFAVAGESAGAYLALLYAYDQDAPERLGLALEHAIRADAAVSIAGPVDLLAMDASSLAPSGVLASGDPTLVVRNLVRRLAGLPDGADDAAVRSALAPLQPVALVSPRSVPTVLAYGRVFPFASSDGIVPVSQMEALAKALAEKGVVCRARTFPSSHHGRVAADAADWIAATLRGL